MLDKVLFALEVDMTQTTVGQCSTSRAVVLEGCFVLSKIGVVHYRFRCFLNSLPVVNMRYLPSIHSLLPPFSLPSDEEKW